MCPLKLPNRSSQLEQNAPPASLLSSSRFSTTPSCISSATHWPSFPTRTVARSGCASIKAVTAALKKIYKVKDADAGCTKWRPRGVKASRPSSMTLLMVHGTEISCHRSVRAAELAVGDLVLCFPGRSPLDYSRMKSASLFLLSMIFSPSTDARMTKSQAGGCKPGRLASSPLLLRGVRAPGLRSTRLPLADEPLVSRLSSSCDVDLSSPQLLDVVGIGDAALAALLLAH